MEPFNEFYSYYSGCGIHIKELHKTTKTTISSIRVAAPCPLPLPTKEKRFSFVGEGCGYSCLLYTSDAADEEDSVDLGGRRIIKKKKR